MATRVIPGTLREVWQELTPLDGGATQVISTGLAVGSVAASGLARLLANLYVTPVAGVPIISATVANVNGRAVVTIANAAVPGNTATYVLDITKLQSTQQGIGGAGGVVHVIMPGVLEPTSVATWGFDVIRHFLVDPVGGDDANPGYVDAPIAAASIATAGKAVKTLARYMALIPRAGAGRLAISHFANSDYATGTALAEVLDYSAFSGYGYFLVRAWTAYDSTIACWSARDRVIAGARIAIPGPNADGSWTVDTVDTTKTLKVTVAAGGAALADDAATLFRIRFSGNVTPAMSDLRCTVYKSYTDTLETCEPPYDNDWNTTAPAAGDTFWIERPGFMVDGFREAALDNETVPDPFLSTTPLESLRATVGLGFAGGAQSVSLGSTGIARYCFCETISADNYVASASSEVACMNFSEFYYKPDGSAEYPWTGFRFAGAINLTHINKIGWGSSSGSVRAPTSTSHGTFIVEAETAEMVGALMCGVFLGGLSIDAKTLVLGSNSNDETWLRKTRIVRVLETLSTIQDHLAASLNGVDFDNGLLKLGSAVRSTLASSIYIANCSGGPVAGCATNTGIYCRTTRLAQVAIDLGSVTLTGAGGDVQLANGAILAYTSLAVADFTDSTGTRWVGSAGTVFVGDPRPGARLTNADVVVAPGTAKVSFYELPAATLTGNHQVTVQVTDMLPQQAVCIRRRDLTANTYAIVNGGVGGGTLVTLPASPGAVIDAWVKLDAAGTNMELDRVEYRTT